MNPFEESYFPIIFMEYGIGFISTIFDGCNIVVDFMVDLPRVENVC